MRTFIASLLLCVVLLALVVTGIYHWQVNSHIEFEMRPLNEPAKTTQVIGIQDSQTTARQ